MHTKQLIKYIKRISVLKKVAFILFSILGILYYYSLPTPLFDKPYSTVLSSNEGELLAAQIATDGQWRFPISDSVPYKFKTSILLFEDQYFNFHWGINPVSTIKALVTNLSAKNRRIGASTLTQQTIRLSRLHKPRTYKEKIIEALLATRLEFAMSKEQILNLYASHAPFGGNVVGLQVAAWRYFNTTPHQLSWAQSATLAVLPNAPSLIHFGKNKHLLLAKRNRLLKKIYQKGYIDQSTYEISLIEPLGDTPHPLPQTTPHLLALANKQQPGKYIKTTINATLQYQANQLIEQYYNIYKQAQIHNIAAIIVDVKTRQILTYIGNSPTDNLHQKDVDIIQAPRSTASVIKPFLSMAMLEDGQLLPEMLLPDIPVVIAGFKPSNYSFRYQGAVPANKALISSLNIPFVLMLQSYGIYKFYDDIQKLGLTSIDKHPNHYGLSLILGGAESSLWEITRAYTTLSSTLTNYTNSNGYYRNNELANLIYDSAQEINFGDKIKESTTYNAGSIYSVFKELTQVNRPEEDQSWQTYESSRKIAWKTGTSYGARDAWSIGTTKDYVVGVWVGNATGEGRPSISGVRLAAPILFDLFNLLPKSQDFAIPYDNLNQVIICQTSGYIATEICPTSTQWVPESRRPAKHCSFHQLVHLDSSLTYQVNSLCEPIENIKNIPWFILPPTWAYYYKKSNGNYQDLPALREDCFVASDLTGLDFIYPKHQDIVHLTKDFNSKVQPFVATAATSSPENILYWYIDNYYIGQTTQEHKMKLEPTVGEHTITIVNDLAQRKSIIINIGQ